MYKISKGFTPLLFDMVTILW